MTTPISRAEDGVKVKTGELCPHCDGEGEVEHPFLQGAYGGSHAINPPDPVMLECEDCAGTGQVLDDE